MKIKSVLLTIILILVLSLTVGFSAFVSEMSISNIVADVRIKSDVRITGIGITGGSFSGSYSDLNWDVDSVMLDDLISSKGDYVNLEVTITNFESAEMGIYNIDVPNGIDFEIANYNMESKICDDNGKCNLGISKTLQFKVSNYNYTDADSVRIDFEFREVHSVTYEGFASNSIYPDEVIDGSYLSFEFRNEIPESVIVYKDGVKLDSSEYEYLDNNLTINDVNGNLVIKSAKNLFNIIKLKTNGVDTNINFGSVSSATNGDGVNTFSGTENNEYPVYYYRGNVTDNNLVFANKCWKIVRTTDTGGIKLIYNGVPADAGSCDNTGAASQIGTSMFNQDSNSPTYFGYMYGVVYPIDSLDLSNQVETYIYGNDVTWNGTNYLLSNTRASSSWSTDRSNLYSTYHYTCFNSSGVCNEVYYINYFGIETTAYYFTFTNGKKLEDVKSEMLGNDNDSIVKKTVDSWYKDNLINYTGVLEDTVWCNDRKFAQGGLYNKDSDADLYTKFESSTRNLDRMTPSVSCPEIRDSFTVSAAIGNGKLIYPIGLLTADEYTLAGNGIKGGSSSSYLNSKKTVWTMTPYFFNYDNGYIFDGTGTYMNYSKITQNGGIRPAISLNNNALVSGGVGSTTDPYIIDWN